MSDEISEGKVSSVFSGVAWRLSTDFCVCGGCPMHCQICHFSWLMLKSKRPDVTRVLFNLTCLGCREAES